MKRRKLLKKVKENGWYLDRRGGNHDIYTDGQRALPIPRHSEINEHLAEQILKTIIKKPNENE